MNGWTTAWTDTEAAAPERGTAARLGAWGFYAFTAALSLWLFLYLSGLFPTLGRVEGSERHGAGAVRLAEESGFGLPTIYLARGQKAWWDYEVEVEGEGGVRVLITKALPSEGFTARAENLRASARGRFEVVAPEGGFYSFSHELVPIGGPLGGARPGATRYKLSWGVS